MLKSWVDPGNKVRALYLPKTVAFPGRIVPGHRNGIFHVDGPDRFFVVFVVKVLEFISIEHKPSSFPILYICVYHCS